MKKLGYHTSGRGDRCLGNIASVLVTSGREIDRERAETPVAETEREASWRAPLPSADGADPYGSA